MPSILGVCPFGGTPLGVWRAKVGLGQQGSEQTPDTMRGVLLEPIIRDLYRRETGRTVEHSENLLRHPSETWAIAHLDGVIFPCDGDLSPGVLEIKAPRIRGFVALEEYGIPAHYQIQIQHYLAVTGYQWADFCAWNADCFRLLIVRVNRDQGLIDLMFERGRDFWTRHVLTGIPPDTSAPTVLRLDNLAPTVLRLDNLDWRDAAEQWAEAKEIAGEAERHLAACRDRLTRIAADEGYAKVRGAGISLTVGKNGTVTIRHNKQEIMQ